MVFVELVEVDAEFRAVVFGRRLVGGHDAAGHVEEQGPSGEFRSEHAVGVGDHHAVGGEGRLVVVGSVGAGGDGIAFFGERLHAHRTLHVELFGGGFRLYADTFVVCSLCTQGERKHGETE